MAIKTQIQEKLENGSTQVIHPETDASVVIINDDRQFVTKAQKQDLEELIQMKDNNQFGGVLDVRDYDGNSLVDSSIAKLPDYIKASEKGVSNGVATLGSDGRVPSSQLPAYVDDVLEYNNRDSFPATGESGKIYVAKDTNKTYRWSGSVYVVISDTLALGETTGTAYEGSKGKQNADNIANLTTRVGSVETKATNNASDITKITNGTTKVGKATSADKFSSNKTLTISGDASGSVTTDFSSNPTLTLTLSNTGVAKGTYSAVGVDTKGRVTSGGQVIEVGDASQTTPSESLVIGGIFFKRL